NGFQPVGLDMRRTPPAHAGQNVTNDLSRILATWIIARDDRNIGQRRRLSEQRTFRPISVATGSEYAKDSPRRQGAQGLQAATQSVVGVGIIDEHVKRLPAVDPLQSPWD